MLHVKTAVMAHSDYPVRIVSFIRIVPGFHPVKIISKTNGIVKRKTITKKKTSTPKTPCNGKNQTNEHNSSQEAERLKTFSAQMVEICLEGRENRRCLMVSM